MSRQLLAVWGETEGRKIFQLIVLNDSVLALTHSGVYLFPSQLSEYTSTVQVLVPSHHCPHSGSDHNVGVYIPRSGNLPNAEVWACPQGVPLFQVFSPEDITVKEEVVVPPSLGRKIRHLESTVVQGKSYLFVADRHILQKWEVASRTHLDALDCHAACWTNAGGGESHVNSRQLRQGRVTSLTGDEGTLYVGNGAGIILLVNADTVEVTCRLNAYSTPVRCLFSIKMSQAFSRMISLTDSTTLCSNVRNNNSLSTISTATSLSSLDSVMTPEPDSPAAFNDRSVLMSFGIGYRGVVGSHKNHPDSFLLPSSLTSCPCCTHFFIQAQPSPSTGYLLLWSMESSCQHYGHSTIYDNGEEHLDGSSE